MPARILSIVLFPLPFGPMIPKNSPCATSNETSTSACWRSYVVRCQGWRNTSLNVVVLWCGNTNDLLTFRTSKASERTSDTLREPRLIALEQVEAEAQHGESD